MRKEEPYFNKVTKETWAVFLIVLAGVYTGLSAAGLIFGFGDGIEFAMKFVLCIATGIGVVMFLGRFLDWK